MVFIGQQSFASGEVSPSLYGQVDSSQYQNGCRVLENGLILPTGAAKKRYGTEHLFGTPTDGGLPDVGTFPAAVFPYYARGRQYVVMISSKDDTVADTNTERRILNVIDCVTRAKISFSTQTTRGPFDAAATDDLEYHPYQASQLKDIYSFQDRDRIYFCHPAHPTISLKRVVKGGVEKWEYGLAANLAGTPRLVDYSVGFTISELSPTRLQASLPRFTKDDELAIWRLGGAELTNPAVNDLGSWWQTTGYRSPTEMDGRRLYGSPGADLTDWTGPFRPSEAADSTFNMLVASSSVNDVRQFDITAGTLVLRRNMIGLPIRLADEFWLVNDVTSATSLTARRLSTFTGTIAAGSKSGNLYALGGRNGFLERRSYLRKQTVQPLAVSGTVEVWSGEPLFGDSQNDPWLPDGIETAFDRTAAGVEVGGTIHLNGGIIAITGVSTTGGPGSNETIYTGEVVKALAHKGPTMQWGLGPNLGLGFASCGASHQGRIAYGGFQEEPARVFLSRTNDPEDFEFGDLDDEAMFFDISDPNGGQVTWMDSAGDLLIGTTTGEFALGGEPVTPTNLAVRRQSAFGGRSVRPALVGGAVVFVGAGGTSIREMSFAFENDRYLSPDLTDLARHIFEELVIDEIAYVSTPEQVIYARDTNGKMYGLSFWRQNGVVGWSRFTQPIFPKETGTETEESTILSMAAVRSDGVNIKKDELWVVRQYVLSGSNSEGSAAYTVERMTPDFFTDMEAPTQTIGQAAAQLDLIHGGLEGTLAPQVIADGVYIGAYDTTLLGFVTYPSLSATPTVLRAGRAIRFELAPTNPYFQVQGQGSNAGKNINVTGVNVMLRDSTGGTVDGGKIMPPGVSVPALVLDTAVSSLTGWRQIVSTGEHGRNTEINIVQDLPYYFELAGLNLNIRHSS